jgi:hypothetical protein
VLSTNADGTTSTTYPHNPTQEVDEQSCWGRRKWCGGSGKGGSQTEARNRAALILSAIFAGGHKLASDGAHLIHEGGYGVQSQVRRGGGPRALSTYAIAYRKHSLAFVKHSCWFIWACILGSAARAGHLIVETVKGRNRFSNDKPGIRYFSPSSDSFPGTYVHDPGTAKTVSAFAIH